MQTMPKCSCPTSLHALRDVGLAVFAENRAWKNCGDDVGPEGLHDCSFKNKDRLLFLMEQGWGKSQILFFPILNDIPRRTEDQ